MVRKQNYVTWKQFHIIRDIYKDITEGIVTRFDTSNYELDRPLPMIK